MPTRRQLRRLRNAKHLFPWVSNTWTSLQEEQQRQQQRLATLAPIATTTTYSILKGVCTLYGTQPGTTCKICKVVHRSSDKDIQMFDEVNKEEDASGKYLNGHALKQKMNRTRYKNILKHELKERAIGRMQRAANALKRRRRTREKKMGVDKDAFLQDFTDTGGRAVTREMKDAIKESFRNQNMDPKAKRFKASMKTKGGMLKFPKIGTSNDNFNVHDELKRIIKKDRRTVHLQKKQEWRKRNKREAKAMQRRNRKRKQVRENHNKMMREKLGL